MTEPLLKLGSILISTLYICLVVGYSRKLLTPRVPPTVSYLALPTALLILSLSGFGEPFLQLRWLAFLLLLALYYAIVFVTPPIHVLFFCNLVLFPLMILRNILLVAVSLYTQRSTSAILHDTQYPFVYPLLAYVLACAMLVWLRHRYAVDKVRLLLGATNTLRLLAYAQTVLNVFLLGATLVAYVDGHAHWFSIYHLGSCLLLLLVFYSILGYCVNLSCSSNIELRAALLEDQLEKQLHHYSLMSDHMSSLRKLEHDYRGMVTGLTRLLELQDTAGALAFVQDMQGQLVQATGSYRSYSNHPFVQAILTDAAEQAARNGIDFRAEVAVPTGFPLREIDICRIFSNLLSNAAEACARLTDSPRYMVLTGCRQGGWFSLTVENSFDGELLDAGGRVLTRKGDAAMHGMGLQNVQEIVELSGGVLRLAPDPQAGRFVVHLHLPCATPAALSPTDVT